MNPIVAFMGGGGVVIILILLPLILWVLALFGSPILIFFGTRSIRRNKRRRGWVFIALAGFFIVAAPSLTYYLQHTFETANKAIHERDVREAVERRKQLREVEARSAQSRN